MHLPAVFDDRKPTVVPLITLFYIRGMQIRWLYSRINIVFSFFLTHVINRSLVTRPPSVFIWFRLSGDICFFFFSFFHLLPIGSAYIAQKKIGFALILSASIRMATTG